MKKKIFAISGSTRQNSTNQAILKYISNSFIDWIAVEIFQELHKIPLFNPDLDNENPPPIVTKLRKSIKEADAVIISTPEYIYSLPGGLKNLIDWNVSTTIFKDKPVAIIVAAASGEKAFESLDLVMATITVSKIPENLKLLIKGVRSKIEENGKIKDEQTASQINQIVNALIAVISIK